MAESDSKRPRGRGYKELLISDDTIAHQMREHLGLERRQLLTDKQPTETSASTDVKTVPSDSEMLRKRQQELADIYFLTGDIETQIDLDGTGSA